METIVAFESAVNDREVVAIVTDSENTAIVDRETGEILEVMGAPEDTVEIEEIATWVGQKRAYALAKLEGLEAEKKALIARIDDQYDPQIKRYDRFAEWCKIRYFDRLRGYACQLLEGQKARSVKIHLLTLAFRKTRPKTSVVDADAALAWAEARCPEAVTKSLLVSMVPVELLDEALEHGFAFYPGGEDKFEIK